MFAHDQVWEQLEATRILATDIRAGAVKPHEERSGTRFYKLPSELWRPTESPDRDPAGCWCSFCKHERPSYWDTLAVDAEGCHWICHYPGLAPNGGKA